MENLLKQIVNNKEPQTSFSIIVRDKKLDSKHGLNQQFN